MNTNGRTRAALSLPLEPTRIYVPVGYMAHVVQSKIVRLHGRPPLFNDERSGTNKPSPDAYEVHMSLKMSLIPVETNTGNQTDIIAEKANNVKLAKIVKKTAARPSMWTSIERAPIIKEKHPWKAKQVLQQAIAALLVKAVALQEVVNMQRDIRNCFPTAKDNSQVPAEWRKRCEALLVPPLSNMELTSPTHCDLPKSVKVAVTIDEVSCLCNAIMGVQSATTTKTHQYLPVKSVFSKFKRLVGMCEVTRRKELLLAKHRVLSSLPALPGTEATADHEPPDISGTRRPIADCDKLGHLGIANNTRWIRVASILEPNDLSAKAAGSDCGLNGLNAAGVDWGMRTMYVVYDVAGQRVFFIGEGLAQFLDVTFQKPRRSDCRG